MKPPMEGESLPMAECLVTRLRCENQIDPIGISALKPRLSWQVDATARGWLQTSYQVIVGSSSMIIADGQGDVWDSGQRMGDFPFIDYKGRTLDSREILYWAVRVWDSTGSPSAWSTPGRFEMALLSESDWGGAWIGGEFQPKAPVIEMDGARWIKSSVPASQMAFRGILEIPVHGSNAVIHEAFLAVTARTECPTCDIEIHCNGQYLSKGLLGSGRIPLVIAADALLRPGRNVMAIFVNLASIDSEFALAVHFEAVDQDGKIIIRQSEATWMAAPARPDWDALVVKDEHWPGVVDDGLMPKNAQNIDSTAATCRDPHPVTYLRRSFLLAKPITRARLFCVGLGSVELRINGERVGTGIREPGPSAYQRRFLAVAHDVTAMLTCGDNVIGAILGTGWYDVHDEAVWFFHRAPWRGRPRLRLHLAVEHPDGTVSTLWSDDSWSWRHGPMLRDGVYTGEVYDARLAIPGWDRPGTPPGSWYPVVVMAPPAGRIDFRTFPPVRVTRHLRPVAILRPRPGVQIADFGEHFAGHVRLRVEAPRGSCIRLRYGEVLDACGMLNCEALSKWMTPLHPEQPFQTDVYLCAGLGVEEWEPTFSLHGFRYVEIMGCPSELAVDDLVGCYAHTDLETSGGFQCSHTIANRLQEATVRSYHSNAQGIPTDCPQREKNGWTADVHLACEAGLINFRSADFYANWLVDVAESQRDDGGIPVIVPTSGWGDGLTWPGAINPAWDCAFHLVAWAVWHLRGDDRLLRRHAGSLGRYVDLLWSQSQDGVPAGGILGDWLPWSETAPNRLVDAVYLAEAARIAAVAARMVGDLVGGERYESISKAACAGLNREFLSDGRYGNGSQCAQALPMQFGLVPDSSREQVLRWLVEDVEKKLHVDAGVLGAKALLRVLAECGRVDLAWRCLVRTEKPGWGAWIAQGATTLWEDWDGSQSRNHVLFADVSVWLIQWISGISAHPDAPGFNRVLMRPHCLPDLQWAQGWHESPRGKIASAWNRIGGRIIWEISLPPGTTAQVFFPCAANTAITENGQMITELPGSGIRSFDAHAMMMELGSGNYTFEIPCI